MSRFELVQAPFANKDSKQSVIPINSNQFKSPMSCAKTHYLVSEVSKADVKVKNNQTREEVEVTLDAISQTFL